MVQSYGVGLFDASFVKFWMKDSARRRADKLQQQIPFGDDNKKAKASAKATANAEDLRFAQNDKRLGLVGLVVGDRLVLAFDEVLGEGL